MLIFHLWLPFEEIVRSDIAAHLDLGRRKRSASEGSVWKVPRFNTGGYFSMRSLSLLL